MTEEQTLENEYLSISLIHHVALLPQSTDR